MTNYILKIAISFIMICIAENSYSQHFSKEDEYKQVMENAKIAFDAKKYSEAVMFYKQAQVLNPKSNLPRYKIEDIRTIYIERELKKQPVVVSDKKDNKLSKKELEVKKEADDKIKEAATRKMYQDAENARIEIEELKVEPLELEIDEDNIPIEESDVDEVERSVETISSEMVNKEVDLEIDNKPVIEVVKREYPVIEEEKVEALDLDTDEYLVDDVVIAEPEETKKPQKQKVVTESVVKKVNTVENKPIAEMSPAEKEVYIEVENKRLISMYPDEKTVEEIDKPGKHVTRVIMNISGKVTVYLKVVHGWGATYYFMDKPGQEMQSINEIFFNRMTNLKTYGD